MIRFYFYEFAHERLVHVHHGAVVVEVAHVARCAEDGYKSPVREELVAIGHHLVRSRYQIYIQFITNILHGLLVESYADAATFIELVVRPLPRLRIGPHKIAQESVVGYVLWLFDLF